MDKGLCSHSGASMVSLFVDLQGAQTEGSSRRGIGRYTRDMVRALLRSKELEQLYLGWNNALTSPVADFSEASVYAEVISAPYGVHRRSRYARSIYDLQREVNDTFFRQALAHSRCKHVLFSSLMETDETNFMLPRHLNFSPFSTSYGIVYDIIPYLYPDPYLRLPSDAAKYEAHLRVKLGADRLLAISETTRLDLIRHLGIDPDRVVTIGAGVEPSAFEGRATDERDFRNGFGLTRPFLFFLGGDEFRKNLPGLIRALPYLPKARRDTLQLLVAGAVADENKAAFMTLAQAGGLPEDAIRFGQFLTHEALLAAYRYSLLTVIPSHYEGFGLPVLEAMACGAAVVASGNSSMSEILTDRDFLFDSTSPQDIASRIEYALTHPQHVEALRASYAAILANHGWQRVAERILDTFRAVESGQNQTRSARRKPAIPCDIVMCGAPSPDVAAALLGLMHTTSLRVFAPGADEERFGVLTAYVERLSHLPPSQPDPGLIPVLVNDFDNLSAVVRQIEPSRCLVLFGSNRKLAEAHERIATDQGRRGAIGQWLERTWGWYWFDGPVLRGAKTANSEGLPGLETLLERESALYNAAAPHALAVRIRHQLDRMPVSWLLSRLLSMRLARLASTCVYDWVTLTERKDSSEAVGIAERLATTGKG